MTKETFQLKKEHIKLLRSSYIDWNDCETGAPCIDPKRPYGNSSVAYDIAKILKWKVKEELTEEQEHEALELHYQTQNALRIILQLKTFRPGKFKQTNYNEWKRV